MSFASKASKILTNKYFLYFVGVLAVMNVFGYLVMNKLNAVIFFALVGIILSFFSKNMAVILLICILTTNLLMSNKTMREGLENASEEPMKKEDKNMNKKNSLSNLPTASSSSRSDDGPILPPSDINNTDLNQNVDELGSPEPSLNTMSNMNSNKKAPKNGSKGRIDYASTLEEAYDNLDKILGEGGINRLTGDTQKLMSQQQKLFESMQAMTPMLQQAGKLLEGFDLKQLGGLASLATSFTPSASA
jgi:hypothetical protein